ncbi:hypothetical protein [Arthrobacter sp. ok909]|uniref:hypothetical protein n=1 Tax=Arthrobacter sp. ok909 TaxID=1761746 RepID=UPI0034A4486A
MPIHIAQHLLGHINLNTTQGYVAVYPNKSSRTTAGSSTTVAAPARNTRTETPRRKSGLNSRTTALIPAAWPAIQ